jgi:hypothetical protein
MRNAALICDEGVEVQRRVVQWATASNGKQQKRDCVKTAPTDPLTPSPSPLA